MTGSKLTPSERWHLWEWPKTGWHQPQSCEKSLAVWCGVVWCGEVTTGCLRELPVIMDDHSLRQFGSTTDFVSYLVCPIFKTACIFQFVGIETIVCKNFTLKDPFIVKDLKIFPKIVFNSLNLAFWDTEHNAKNYSLLQNIVLTLFLTKNAFLTILRQFFLIFQERCCVEGCVFLRCVQYPKTLNLSYQKQHSEIFSNISP